MFTPEQIKNFIETEKLPFWKINNGSKKLYEFASDNLSESIQKFQFVTSQIPSGKFEVYAAEKEKNGGGGLHWPMEIGEAKNNHNTMQQSPISITEEQAERNLFLRKIMKYETELIWLGKNQDRIEKLFNAVEKIQDFIEELDTDGDGKPDFMESMMDTGKDLAKEATKKAASKFSESVFSKL